jgi:CubicO group peptidase (beta-lactamase class C family)
MKKAKLLIFVILFSVPLCSQISSGRQLSKKIDELIARSYQSIAPGCVVLVSKKDKLIYEKGFGKANIELNDLLRPEMLFRIGSITKQYTAIAILQLIEQGRILLQDSLQKFIEGFPHKGSTITIENLLTHTSGIVDYEVLDFHVPNAIRIDFPPKQIIDSLAVLPLAFIPGTQYRYSNSNYFLLGFVLEKVTGKSYKTYMKENIFTPLGLSETCYDSPEEIIKNRVFGYTKGTMGYQNAGYLSMNQVFSAGALLASARDLFKWHQALYAYKVVKKETLDKAVAPFQFSDGKLSEYGYGWFIKEFRGNKLIGHGGAIDGFRSMEAYLPEQDIFIAALFNSDNDGFFPLFENIISLVAGRSLEASY